MSESSIDVKLVIGILKSQREKAREELIRCRKHWSDERIFFQDGMIVAFDLSVKEFEDILNENAVEDDWR